MLLEALKARNEVAVSAPRRPTRWFHFAPLAAFKSRTVPEQVCYYRLRVIRDTKKCRDVRHRGI